MIGRGLQVIFAPLGFNWQISVALVPDSPPGSRSERVGYGCTRCRRAVTGRGSHRSLPELEYRDRPVAAGLVCLRATVSVTLSVVKRETTRGATVMMAAYLFALAYVGSFATYHIAVALGGLTWKA